MVEKFLSLSFPITLKTKINFFRGMTEKKIGAVVAIVHNNGKILLGKKKSIEGRTLSGAWHIPGETLEPGEDEINAIVRGVKKDAGISVRVLRYLAQHEKPDGTLVKWYESTAISPNKIRPGGDLERVKWVSFRKVYEQCDDSAKKLWPEEIVEYFTKRAKDYHNFFRE